MDSSDLRLRTPIVTNSFSLFPRHGSSLDFESVGAPLVGALFGPNHAEGRLEGRLSSRPWEGRPSGRPVFFRFVVTLETGAWKDAGPSRRRGRRRRRPSRSAPGRTPPLGWRGVILGALFRALGEIEARRLDVLVLFFEGRSVLSLVFALGGRTNAGGERRCGRSVFLECEVVRRRRGRRRSFTCNMDTPRRVKHAAPHAGAGRATTRVAPASI